MPGPSPKPTALRSIEGNRGKRAMNKQEPDPEYLPDASLVAPAYLSSRAAAVWNEIAPPLQKARLVAVIDVPLLAMACDAIARCRYASSMIGDEAVRPGSSAEKTIDVSTQADDSAADAVPAAAASSAAPAKERGESLNPWLIVHSMSFKQAFAILREFGVSPAARTRIAIQPQMDLFGNGKTAEDKEAKYFGKSA